MTELIITPNYAKKTARFKGTIAAGEHVLVKIANDDGAVEDTTNLRLRVVGEGGKTLAQFPMPDTEDAWDSDITPISCEFDLNTDRMLKAVPPAATVPLLFVLDAYKGKTDDDDGEFVLYFKDRCEVTHWPRRSGEDEPVPTILDDYADIIADFREDIYGEGGFKDVVENAASVATDAANRVSAALETADNFVDSAETAATNAQNSANGASNSKQNAEAWAVGERGGEAVGTDDETYHNNAKYYAEQAGDAKTDAETAKSEAETAQGAAESAQAAAEAWATGGTGGTPTATNNAKYYAEQAADSAQDAEEALEDKADKVASATNGNFAGLDSNGNLTDSGKKAADFAPATDIAKTALASDVQTSLGKADSAVQPSDILSDNKIKTALLPSFVDDVLEFSALANFPATGETGKIYVAKDTNKTYRWSGSSYVEISASLALGETSSTAYRGDKGKTAYDHATDSNRLTTAKVSGLYKIATTAEGHVKSVTAVEKSDITALGIPAQDTTYTLPSATASTLGGVKQGTGCTIEADGTLNVTGGSGGTVDDTVTRTSENPVKSSGIWSAIWGALTALPTGFASLYDYCMGWFADAKSIAPVWGFGILYHVGDFCVESRMEGASGRLYRCKKEYTPDSESSGPSFDAEHWEPIDVKTLIANKQDALSAAQLANIAAVPGKADAADLRYRIAEAEIAPQFGFPASMFPVVFTMDGTTYTITSADDLFIDYISTDEGYHLNTVVGESGGLEEAVVLCSVDSTMGQTGAPWVTSLTFNGESSTTLTVTNTSTLADRAVNRITADDETSIDIGLPALANVGRMRDFYVRLTVSATSAATWTIGQGESWDAMGSPPSSFAAGTYLYHISEVAAGVWHCEDLFGVLNRIPMYQVVGVTPSSGTLTVSPYTVSTYTAGDSAAAFTVAVGTGASGVARDCELVIDCTETGAVAPTVTWPATFHPRTDAATDFACEAGKRNVYFISEYASGEFAVGGWQETAGGNA